MDVRHRLWWYVVWRCFPLCFQYPWLCDFFVWKLVACFFFIQCLNGCVLVSIGPLEQDGVCFWLCTSPAFEPHLWRIWRIQHRSWTRPSIKEKCTCHESAQSVSHFNTILVVSIHLCYSKSTFPGFKRQAKLLQSNVIASYESITKHSGGSMQGGMISFGGANGYSISNQVVFYKPGITSSLCLSIY